LLFDDGDVATKKMAVTTTTAAAASRSPRRISGGGKGYRGCSCYRCAANLFVFIFVAFSANVVSAWGRYGHEIVGNLAWRMLPPPPPDHDDKRRSLRDEIRSILFYDNETTTIGGQRNLRRRRQQQSNGDDDVDDEEQSENDDAYYDYYYDSSSTSAGGNYDRHKNGGTQPHPQHNTTCDEPCTPLGRIANWADAVKHLRQYSWSAPLHYLNVHDNLIEGGCPVVDDDYDDDIDHRALTSSTMTTTTMTSTKNNYTRCYVSYGRDCVDDVCAPAAIANYSSYLRRNNAKPRLWQQQQDESFAGAASSLPASASQRRTRRKGPGGRRLESEQQPPQRYPLQDQNNNNPSPVQVRLRESLMFLVHFVGDLHQPLHSSRATDLGGNTIRVEFRADSGVRASEDDHDGSTGEADEEDSGQSDRTPPTSSFHLRNRFNRRRRLSDASIATSGNRSHNSDHHYYYNLHSVWDDGIIERSLEEDYGGSRFEMERAIQRYILQQPADVVEREWLRCPDGSDLRCALEWGEESFQYAMSYAYKDAGDRGEVVNGTALSDEYYATRLPVVVERLAVAAVRLASTLVIALQRQVPRQASSVVDAAAAAADDGSTSIGYSSGGFSASAFVDSIMKDFPMQMNTAESVAMK